MAGGAKAVSSGNELIKQVHLLAESLDLEAREQYKVARRIWGAERHIDIVLRHKTSGKVLGIECKYQEVQGTAEEKIPSTIQDIDAWPIDGIVVFSGEGFTDNMKAFLISTGKAVTFKDLEPWLRLYFGLPLSDH
jgi:Archaea bacterial proteins of unknown function